MGKANANVGLIFKIVNSKIYKMDIKIKNMSIKDVKDLEYKFEFTIKDPHTILIKNISEEDVDFLKKIVAEEYPYNLNKSIIIEIV